MYVCWVGVGVGVGEGVGDGAVRGRGEVRVMRIDLKFQLIYIYKSFKQMEREKIVQAQIPHSHQFLYKALAALK